MDRYERLIWMTTTQCIRDDADHAEIVGHAPNAAEIQG